jgi:hypothetical protein
MADITMCSGDGCSIKESCYRFTAPINEYAQSYFMEVMNHVITIGKDVLAIANRICIACVKEKNCVVKSVT